jgi:hypothetical protein
MARSSSASLLLRLRCRMMSSSGSGVGRLWAQTIYGLYTALSCSCTRWCGPAFPALLRRAPGQPYRCQPRTGAGPAEAARAEAAAVGSCWCWRSGKKSGRWHSRRCAGHSRPRRWARWGMGPAGSGIGDSARATGSTSWAHVHAAVCLRRAG